MYEYKIEPMYAEDFRVYGGNEETYIAKTAQQGWRLIQLISFDNGALAGITKYYWERKIPLEGKKKYVYSCDPVAEEICGSCPKLDSCAAAEIHGYTK